MSSVFEEAWESLRIIMANTPTEEYEGVEIVGMMSRLLHIERQRAKEYHKEQFKEIK